MSSALTFSLLFLVSILFLCLPRLTTPNPRLRPNYPPGIPGFQGHAAVTISRSILPAKSLYYMNESAIIDARAAGSSTTMTLIYGGYSNFIQNYTEFESGQDSRLNSRVYLYDEVEGQMVLFWSNGTNEVMIHFEEEVDGEDHSVPHDTYWPGARAYFDYQLVGGNLLWLSGGIKQMFLRREFAGIADACLWGDVWQFNITSGKWRQLVQFETVGHYRECEYAHIFKAESAFDFIFLYTLVATFITITVTWAFCITCC